MCTSHRPSLIAAVATLCLWAGPAVGKPRVKPARCPGGRFLVEGPRLVGSTREAGGDAVVIAGTLVSIDSGCEPVTGKFKATKRGTKVRARWASCAGAPARVALTATIQAGTCDTVRGALKGKQVRRRFRAGFPTPPVFTTGVFAVAPLAQATVGPAGGTVAVTDPASPLHGLIIEILPNATAENVTFEVTYADITGVTGLPAGAASAGPLIRIAASGSAAFNQYRMLDIPARITLPYTPPAEGEETARYYVLNADGTLESAGYYGQDMDRHTLTFLLRAFGDTAPESVLPAPAASQAAGVHPTVEIAYSPIQLGMIAWTIPTPTGLNTGFQPTLNGWRIDNPGSYYDRARGGMCFGMVGSAKHYFRRRFTPQLFDAYLDNWPNVTTAPTPTWVDDAVAIQFTSRAQYGLNGMWASINDLLDNPISGKGVMLTIVGALKVTSQPAILQVRESFLDSVGRIVTGGGNANHAIMVYGATVPADFVGNVDFAVYDPNFPGTPRQITWNSTNGFDPFSGDLSGGGPQYNNFNMLGYHAGLTDAALDQLKQAADQSFRGDTTFPTITVQSITGQNTGEPATDGQSSVTGEHKFITSDTSVRIRGTILGGLAQSLCCAVKNASVLVSTRSYNTPVNNGVTGGDGSFDVVVPVPQGEHELAIIGGTYNTGAFPTIDHWAAFHRNIIESTASPAAFTIELSWDKTESDVDLYIQEPSDAAAGKTGDTVFYGHRRGVSSDHPYLEFDNTQGNGPEYYYARDKTKTLYTDGTAHPNLYGTYTVKAHYYSDHDTDAENDQTIGWSIKWRYLAWCPAPCTNPETDGTWKEGTQRGALAKADAANAGSIGNAGPDWSAPITIDYQPAPPPPGGPPRTVNLP